MAKDTRGNSKNLIARLRKKYHPRRGTTIINLKN